jgi:hypothetical protein
MEGKYAHTDGDVLEATDEIYEMFASMGISKNKLINEVDVQNMYKLYCEKVLKKWR